MVEGVAFKDEGGSFSKLTKTERYRNILKVCFCPESLSVSSMGVVAES